MKLHYFHGRGPLKALVMVRGADRLEFYIRPLADEGWVLVALSGPDQGQPVRHHCQGPYRTLARVESVLRSSAGNLMQQGFEPCPSDHVVWAVTAQRLVRTLRDLPADRDSCKIPDPEHFEPLV